jgi:hypothetical protein
VRVVEIRQWTGLVAAAQAGDQRALDELIAQYLTSTGATTRS